MWGGATRPEIAKRPQGPQIGVRRHIALSENHCGIKRNGSDNEGDR